MTDKGVNDSGTNLTEIKGELKLAERELWEHKLESLKETVTSGFDKLGKDIENGFAHRDTAIQETKQSVAALAAQLARTREEFVTYRERSRVILGIVGTLSTAGGAGIASLISKFL